MTRLTRVTRLTRAESQARTRQHLVQTARELFLRDGYLATSLEKVAEAAGYTRGAVYSNFRNKDELCLVVLDDIRADRIGEIIAIATAADLEEQLARLEAWATTVVGDRTWTRLEIEFAAHATRDDALSEQMAGRLNQLLAVLTAGVQTVAEADGIELPLPAYEAAVAILAMGVGLGLFRSIEPALPISALTGTLRALTGRSSE